MPTIKLFDSMRQAKVPLESDHRLLIYTCGPTVYLSPHIGNWRAFIFYDSLARSLRTLSYDYKHVINITDVGHLVSDADEGEDKLQKQADAEKTSAWRIAEHYTAEFMDGWQAVHNMQPDLFAKATDYIEQQIAMVAKLEEKGYTYRIEDGIYFDTSKFSNYGRLARLDLAGQKAGARVETNVAKRQPQDFALWKFSPKDKQRDMEWDSPWGKGFPGWHLECSAIALATLGKTLDIHAGGVDHLSVHHTNEIAQSEAANDQPLARTWLHSEFILVDKQKMSKSLGNIYTLKDIVDRGFDPLDYRLLVLQAHYHSEVHFSWQNMESARARRLNWLRLAERRWQGVEGAGQHDYQAPMNDMLEAAADDLNTPEILKIVDSAASRLEPHGVRPEDTAQVNEFWNLVDQLLGLDIVASTPDISDDISDLLKDRLQARKEGDYSRSDQLRESLATSGYLVEDTTEGQFWYRKH